jgi:hypothetical protein
VKDPSGPELRHVTGTDSCRAAPSPQVVMAFAQLLQVVTLCSSGLGKLLMNRDHYFNNHNHYLPHAIHPGRPSPVSVVLSLL